MSGEEFFANQRKAATPSGNISYLEHGTRPDGFIAL
jgi:hypothetical protein